MPSIFERLENREAFPVDIKGGKVWVREPTFEDIDRVRALDNSTGLSLAICLVNEDKSPMFPPLPDETDSDLAERVIKETRKLTPSSLLAIQQAIQKLTHPVDPNELPKN